MKRSVLNSTLIAVMLSVSPVLAQTTPPTPPDNAASTMAVDRDTFLKEAQSANDWEIKSSELAKKQAEAKGVKKFARMIIKDHEAAGVKLQATLKNDTANAGSPPPPALTPKHQQMLDQLKMANGADFDKLYIDMQTQAHMEAIALFGTYSKSGDDKALAGFAAETLPKLETHLAHVKKLGEMK